MRIGIVTAWGPRGAAYVSRLYEKALEADHEVRVYARGSDSDVRGNPTWDRPNVCWGRDVRSPFSVTMFSEGHFRDWLRRERIEAVIFNEQHWWPPVRWCREMGIRTIAYVDYYTEQTLGLFRHYDALICNTLRHQEAFAWHPRAWYLPWGTDLEVFRPRESGGLVGREHPVFFHSCGVSPGRKGTAAVIRAHAASGARGRLVLHSQVPLAKALPELAGAIRDGVAAGRIELVEGTFEGAGLFARGDVYLYPSVLEGIGLTIAEAVASGLVPVVTDEPPMSEFVRPEFGHLIPVRRRHARADGYYWPKALVDEDALARIIAALDAEPDRVRAMKAAARAHAVAHLDWRSNAAPLSGMISGLDVSPPPEGGWADLEAFERWGGRKLNPLISRVACLTNPLLRLLRRKR